MPVVVERLNLSLSLDYETKYNVTHALAREKRNVVSVEPVSVQSFRNDRKVNMGRWRIKVSVTSVLLDAELVSVSQASVSLSFSEVENETHFFHVFEILPQDPLEHTFGTSAAWIETTIADDGPIEAVLDLSQSQPLNLVKGLVGVRVRVGALVHPRPLGLEDLSQLDRDLTVSSVEVLDEGRGTTRPARRLLEQERSFLRETQPDLVERSWPALNVSSLIRRSVIVL